jgi:hypothetical protein
MSLTEEQLAEGIVTTIVRAIAPIKTQLAALEQRVLLAPRLADLEAQVRTLTEQVVELHAQLASREPVR